MRRNFEITMKLVEMQSLLEFYNKTEIHGYCLSCPDHNRNWSCPTHDFNEYEYLKKYKYAYIISGKIIINKNLNENEIIKKFENERRIFSDLLIDEEQYHNDSIALIAGNCYKCDRCTKLDGKECILKDEMRYSLESLGLKVSDILKEILNQQILWIKETTPEYLITVGAILLYEKDDLVLINGR
ncbi:DUF2284 domain-containing protein [Clostridiaceae bacterium HSG29]|nr:DUF2284 domain-containing protein [Clostridiaceae bacterium HSG29]